MKAEDRSAGRVPAAGAFSVDVQAWRVSWSPGARRIHEFSPDHPVSIWEALDFIDQPDRAGLFVAALRCFRSGEPFDMAAGLTTTTGRRKRVRVTGFLSAPAFAAVPCLKGTIEELPASQPSGQEPDATAQRLLSALREWEIFGQAISHELKAPLGIARGFTAAVQRREGDGLSDGGRLHLSKALNALQRLDELLDALLQFSPLPTRPVQTASVDLSRLALETLELLRARDPQREVQVQIQPGLTVPGDPDLLRLLVSNLLGNAWKFTSSRADASISLVRMSCDRGLVFAVQDNGVGFDMRDATRLFTPFERLHERHHFDGSGVGLAVVRRVVERHGGSVWATSEPGQGATFFFTLETRHLAEGPGEAP